MVQSFPGSYTVGIEFSAGSFTNVVLSGDVLGVDITRAAGDLFDGIRASDAVIMLDNMAGHYSPQNAGSAYAGLLRPNLPVKVEGHYGGTTYPLFRGYIDDISIQPSLPGERTATLSCRDEIKNLSRRIITTSMFASTYVSSVFTSILQAANVNSFQVNLGTADETPYAWFKRRSALGALEEVIRAGYYRAFVDPLGVLQVQGRYWDQQQLVVQSYDNAALNLSYGINDDSVFNHVTVDGQPRLRSTNIRTLAWIEVPILIPGSAGVGFFLDYFDPDNFEPAPADGMVSPVNSSDYLTNVASDGSGVDKTASTSATVTFFGETAVCSIFNGDAAAVYLYKFQLRGKSIQRLPRIAVVSEDSSSQNVYGQRELSVAADVIADRQFIANYADFIKDRFKNPYAGIRMTTRNEMPDGLQFTMGDVIHVQEANTGIGTRFTIIGVRHEIRTQGGWTHTTEWRLDTFRDQEVLILDDPLFGKLDQRKLGL